VAVDLKINEVYFTPEDTAVPDDGGFGRQFIEIVNLDGGAVSLDNVWLLEIEGDAPIGVADNMGEVVNAWDLTGNSTGVTSGLFLVRDTATVLDNHPDPGVQGPEDPGAVLVGGFNQILGYSGPSDGGLEYEHDFVTFLLVQGFTGTAASLQPDPQVPGTDIDGDNDGTVDNTPWTSVLDGLGVTEEGKVGSLYAAQLGGVDIGPGMWFGADAFQRSAKTPEDWLLFDTSDGELDPTYVGLFYANDGSGPGDSDAAYYDVSTGIATEIPVTPASTFLYATPGAANVPEPSCLAILATLLASGAGWRCRHRRSA
jgi:hypothetical protein